VQADGVVVADVAAPGAPELRVGGKDDAVRELRFERMKNDSMWELSRGPRTLAL
jgi:hypothetical protein